ncbi:alpha/beta hydrolase [Cohnella fermenti]|uniref:PD40 domain-containing protein n=1 Tax=Cohnella fermenti TaxID=2565925 RepID=UPI001454C542|nr:PD40 domain-containing protein [Cohnella fermenti]
MRRTHLPLAAWLQLSLVLVLVVPLLPLFARGIEPTAAAASSPSSPRVEEPEAAFVRDGNLWRADGSKEKLLARGPNARNPRWSADGRWIAFAKGEPGGEELWLIGKEGGEEKRISASGGSNFQWSPAGSRLAYQEETRLRWLTVAADSVQVAGSNTAGAIDGVGNYGWLPDGSGFIVSSVPAHLEDEWAPIRISTVTLAHPDRLRPLYAIPSATGSDFAVGTGRFKWSSDGRWVAFQAVPTASMSADSNSLCVLSADGGTFRRVGRMVRNEAWFGWAPGHAALAFIAGEGRESTSNKRLTIVHVPSFQSSVYTPDGYADRDFSWEGDDRIVVSRSVESEWTADPAKRPFPFLARVGLRDRRQSVLTPRASSYGDYDPVAIPAIPAMPSGRLAWVRSDRKSDSRVLLGNGDARRSSVWIPKLDMAPAFYEQFYWSSVLDIR